MLVDRNSITWGNLPETARPPSAQNPSPTPRNCGCAQVHTECPAKNGSINRNESLLLNQPQSNQHVGHQWKTKKRSAKIDGSLLLQSPLAPLKPRASLGTFFFLAGPPPKRPPPPPGIKEKTPIFSQQLLFCPNPTPPRPEKFQGSATPKVRGFGKNPRFFFQKTPPLPVPIWVPRSSRRPPPKKTDTPEMQIRPCKKKH